MHPSYSYQLSRMLPLIEFDQQRAAGQTLWWRWRESNPRPKDSTTKLYERSLPIVVTAGIPAGWLPCSHLLVFRTVSRIVCGTPPLSRPTRCPVENGTGGRGLIEEAGLSSQSLMQREAGQRRKCGWHLIFCAGFTRSAPLGSHSGTSLSRRSLSSPEGGAPRYGSRLLTATGL